ncbi:MAG: XTP/dITP diphosphatase [Candidatus Bathyarchaeia archaeon]
MQNPKTKTSNSHKAMPEKTSRTLRHSKHRVLGFATMNRHKFEEASLILREFNIRLKQLRLKPPEIQSEEPAEIAENCARALVGEVEEPFIVEDAGLFIDGLHGFPGPYSAYVNRTIGLTGILHLMSGMQNRGASFVSALAFVDEKHDVKVFVATVRGEITARILGEHGFGFDPIFKPHGASKTFAEMSTVEKCVWSHRARALRKFASWFLKTELH